MTVQQRQLDLHSHCDTGIISLLYILNCCVGLHHIVQSGSLDWLQCLIAHKGAISELMQLSLTYMRFQPLHMCFPVILSAAGAALFQG